MAIGYTSSFWVFRTLGLLATEYSLRMMIKDDDKDDYADDDERKK